MVMRFTDLAYAFPDLLFIILMRSALKDNDWPILSDPVVQMIVAISFVGWVTVARLVRGQMLSLTRNGIIVLAARAMGASNWRIVFTHMLPNTLGPVIVAVVFAIPLAIFAEAALGYIGLSVPQPTASLGRLVADGNKLHRDAVLACADSRGSHRTPHALLHFPRRRLARRARPAGALASGDWPPAAQSRLGHLRPDRAARRALPPKGRVFSRATSRIVRFVFAASLAISAAAS